MQDFRTRALMLVRLIRDRRGYAMTMFAVLLPAMLGIVGLTVDLSRFTLLHSELQDIADASALAGAAKLDGTEAGLTSAASAATTMTNSMRFASDTSGVQVLAPVFLNCGPTSCAVTTSAALANAVQVTTVNRSVSIWFATAVGVASTAATSARAVAESSYVACGVQPLMLCTPYGTLDLDQRVKPGQMLRLKPKSGQGNLLPGDFGLLDPPNVTTSGGPQQSVNLASSTPNFCYINNVSVKTGGTNGPVQDGTQVRFDIYPSSQNSPLAAMTPAPNVIKGLIAKGNGQACVNPSNADPAEPLPRDTCLPQPGSPASTVGTCAQSVAQSTASSALEIGDGVWSSKAEAYWKNHHTGNMPANLGLGPNAGGMTRYQLYLHETGCNETTGVCSGVPDQGFAWKNGAKVENPAPACAAKSGISPGGLDRRLIYVAVVDCSAQSQQVTGSGTQTTMRGTQLAEFFLTEPSLDGEIYAEFVKLIKPGSSSGKLHHLVQLRR